MSKVMPDMTREKVIRLTNPFIELGIHRGRQEGRKLGRQQGEIELVLRQLKRRLGSLTAAQKEAVRILSLRRIEALGEALLDFNSRSDLDHWLKAHSR
jgi:predicted transposase YdaD